MAWFSAGLSTVGSGGVAPRLVSGESVSVGWLAPACEPPRSRAASSENASRADCSCAIRVCSCSRSIRAFRSDARRLSTCPRRRRSPTASAATRPTSTTAKTTNSHCRPGRSKPLTGRITSHDILSLAFPQFFGIIHRGHRLMLDVRRTWFAIALTAALGTGAIAQDTAGQTQSSTPSSEKNAGSTPKEFKALKYRSIGPAAGGRVSRAAGVPGDPATYYAATASGGVWKSSDGGATWKPIFDDQPVSSIGSIAVAASNPSIVYVGSGEANIRGNVAAG